MQPDDMEAVTTIFESVSSICLSACMIRKTVHFKSTGKIVVGKVLGEGAFSFVYTALSPYRGKKYALKKIYLNSSEYDKIVKAELFSFKEFKHRNILELIDHTYVSEQGGRAVCMLFPLIVHGSLRQVIDRHLTRPTSTSTSLRDGSAARSATGQDLLSVLRHFACICSALNVLHTYSPSYVHQDIKPENVLIRSTGEPLLTDFGSVRVAARAVGTRSQALEVADEAASMCTVSYRAPELFDPPLGLTLDARTDVWAQGALLFAWWHGYSPFECTFSEAGRPRVVECSHSRVLNKIPVLTKPRREDVLVHDLCSWVLDTNILSRPFNADLIARLEKDIALLQNRGGSDMV